MAEQLPPPPPMHHLPPRGAVDPVSPFAHMDTHFDNFIPHFPAQRQGSHHFDNPIPRIIDLELEDQPKKNIETKRDSSVEGRKERGASYSATRGSSSYMEYYRLEKSGDDWSVIDKIRMIAPQHELEKKTRQNNTPVIDQISSMSYLRRAQIDRLIDHKNKEEKDKDTEWVPAFIDASNSRVTNRKGKSIREVLSMDVIVAKQPRGRGASNRRESFKGERVDLRESTKSKDKDKDKEKTKDKDKKKGEEKDKDLWGSERLFTYDGRPMSKGQPLYEDQLQRGGFTGSVPTGGFHPTGPLPMGGQIPLGGHMPLREQMSMGAAQPSGAFHQPLQPAPNELVDLGGPMVVEDRHSFQGGQQDRLNIEEILNLKPRKSQSNLDFKDAVHDDVGRARRLRKKKSRNDPIIHLESPKQRHAKNWTYGDSSVEEQDRDNDSVFLDGSSTSSQTSVSMEHEHERPTIIRRGSLKPSSRQTSVRRERPTYRDHHRGVSYDVIPRRRDSRSLKYADERVEILPERSHARRPELSHGRKTIAYVSEPRQWMIQDREHSPPLSPISNRSYSPPRRGLPFPALPFPDEAIRKERDLELASRKAEGYMRDAQLREREDAVRWKERQLAEKEAEREAERRWRERQLVENEAEREAERRREYERVLALDRDRDRDRDRRYDGKFYYDDRRDYDRSYTDFRARDYDRRDSFGRGPPRYYN